MNWNEGGGIYVEDPEDRTLVYGKVLKYYSDTDSYVVRFERGGYEKIYCFGVSELLNWNSVKPKRILVCVCGSDSIGAPGHSNWCEKYGV